MAEKFRKFASAAAAMAVTLSRPNYFEGGKKGKYSLSRIIPWLIVTSFQRGIG